MMKHTGMASTFRAYLPSCQLSIFNGLYTNPENVRALTNIICAHGSPPREENVTYTRV